MAEVRIFDFGTVLTSDLFNLMLRELFVSGVYDGFTMTAIDTDVFELSAGTCLIASLGDPTSGLLPTGILMQQTGAKQFQIPEDLTQYDLRYPQKFYLAVRYRPQLVVGGVPTETALVWAGPTDDPRNYLDAWTYGYAYVVLGQVNWAGTLVHTLEQGDLVESQKVRTQLERIMLDYTGGRSTDRFNVPFSDGVISTFALPLPQIDTTTQMQYYPDVNPTISDLIRWQCFVPIGLQPTAVNIWARRALTTPPGASASIGIKAFDSRGFEVPISTSTSPTIPLTSSTFEFHSFQLDPSKSTFYDGGLLTLRLTALHADLGGSMVIYGSAYPLLLRPIPQGLNGGILWSSPAA
jgi:hypothetical protein